MNLEIKSFSGDEAKNLLQEVAKLRITVFHEYPYLYDGDLAYEMKYLDTYMNSADYNLIIVTDHGQVVGASTCLPLVQETMDIKQPFLEKGFDPANFMYFGESVLLPEYRGKGIGHQFFDSREAMTLNNGFENAVFCAVQRVPDHPAKPENYKSLEQFWLKRGYQKRDDLITYMNWKDLDEDEESPKPMVFWLKQFRRSDSVA